MLAAWAIREGKQIAHSAKNGAVLPSKEELQKLFTQAVIMVSIALSNNKFYGKTRSIVINRREMIAIIIPLNEIDIVGIVIGTPVNMAKFMTEVEGILAEA